MKTMPRILAATIVAGVLPWAGASPFANTASATMLFNADFDSIAVAQHDPATATFNADTSMLAGSSWTIEEGAPPNIYVQSSSADSALRAVNSDNLGGTATRGLTADFVGSGGEFTGGNFTDIQFIWGRSRAGGTNPDGTQEKEYYARGLSTGGATQIFSLNWDVGGINRNDILFNGNVIGSISKFRAANSLWDDTTSWLIDIRLQSGLADVSIRDAGTNNLVISVNNLALSSTDAIDQLEFDNIDTGNTNVGFWIDNVSVVTGVFIPEPASATLALVAMLAMSAVVRRRRMPSRGRR